VNYLEQTLGFTCQGEHLIGIVARPDEPAAVGVVVIVGGPQYRAGSHRQFVLLSRALAQSGVAVLRFDYRGMGDSGGDLRDFEAVSSDVGAAIDALQLAAPTVKRIALWGLCDGASAALLYCHDTKDSRVAGLCLLNPWVRSEASLARTQVKHYYAQRLMQREFWEKLLRGGVALKALAGLVANLRVALLGTSMPAQGNPSAQPGARVAEPFQAQMAKSWNNFSGSICLILSGNDYTAKEFLEHLAREKLWLKAMDHAKLARHDLPHADHTFSSHVDRQTTEEMTTGWLNEKLT
jgi:uncharacterized protein